MLQATMEGIRNRIIENAEIRTMARRAGPRSQERVVKRFAIAAAWAVCGYLAGAFGGGFLTTLCHRTSTTVR